MKSKTFLSRIVLNLLVSIACLASARADVFRASFSMTTREINTNGRIVVLARDSTGTLLNEFAAAYGYARKDVGLVYDNENGMFSGVYFPDVAQSPQRALRPLFRLTDAHYIAGTNISRFIATVTPWGWVPGEGGSIFKTNDVVRAVGAQRYDAQGHYKLNTAFAGILIDDACRPFAFVSGRLITGARIPGL